MNKNCEQTELIERIGSFCMEKLRINLLLSGIIWSITDIMIKTIKEKRIEKREQKGREIK